MRCRARSVVSASDRKPEDKGRLANEILNVSVTNLSVRTRARWRQLLSEPLELHIFVEVLRFVSSLRLGGESLATVSKCRRSRRRSTLLTLGDRFLCMRGIWPCCAFDMRRGDY